jgi:hypothetical protein
VTVHIWPVSLITAGAYLAVMWLGLTFYTKPINRRKDH